MHNLQGVLYLKYQVSIYKAYSIVKVKGDRESKKINGLLDIYSYGDGGLKEDIALLQTFNKIEKL